MRKQNKSYSHIFRHIYAYFDIFGYIQACLGIIQAYSEPYQISTMQCFAKIVNNYSCFCNICFSCYLIFFSKSLFFTAKVFVQCKKVLWPGGENCEF